MRIANADESAFKSVIESYGSTIYGHALMYLKDAGLAQEVTQDILFNIWKHRSELPNIENFPGYVFIMTRNRIKSLLKRKVASFAEVPEDCMFSAFGGPEERLEYKQLLDIINMGIEQLPPRRKEIFKMSRFGGLGYDQIANQLNIRKSTVKDHILEALVYLRSYLREKHGLIISGFFCIHFTLATLLTGFKF